MKPLVCIIFLAAWLAACQQSSTRKKANEDSLEYYPPAPAAIGKEEFRYYYRELSNFFDTSLLNAGFNGGILIAKNGEIIYEKYSGLTDLRKKDSITAETALHIASTSKTFTATAVLRLIQENKLSLNDTITKFFPALPYPGITVQMLLSHRSGLPNYIYFADHSDWDKKKKATNEDILQIMYRDQPKRSYPPGKRFYYSNTNFMLLAMIVEKVTGKTFPEYMQQKFFGPLQMTHSFVFTLKDTLTATPSFTPSGGYWDYDFLDGTYGDKNIYTTPRDLLKWDQALYSGQVIRAGLLDTAFAPYSFEKPSVHNYGLGWRLQLLPNGKKVVYHFGKWHGFNAAFARLMDEKATIIILGNRFTRKIYSAAHLCYDFFGDYQQRRVNDEEESDSLKATVQRAETVPVKKEKRKP